jgi:hypothetical protein
MGCRLTLAGPQSRFQFSTQALALLFETLGFLLEPLVLFLEPCDLPLGSV